MSFRHRIHTLSSLACTTWILCHLSLPLFAAGAGIEGASRGADDQTGRHRLIRPPEGTTATSIPDASRAAKTTKSAAAVPRPAARTTGPSTPASTRPAAGSPAPPQTGGAATTADLGVTVPPQPTAPSLLRSTAAAAVTAPTALPSSASTGPSKSVVAAPSTAAIAGNAPLTFAPAGRGFTNLLNNFPTLGPTLQVAPAPPAAAPIGSSPAPSSQPGSSSTPPPVPLVTAPPPSTPPPSGTTLGAIALRWNANSEPDLAGYKIHVGTHSGIYDYPGSPFNVGATTATTISNLPRGQTYFFAASAYDHQGNESSPSSEVSKSLY